jgi:hypothetical protein
LTYAKIYFPEPIAVTAGIPHAWLLPEWLYLKSCQWKTALIKKDGSAITRNEQIFLYIHTAQGGSSKPSGKWKSLNTDFRVSFNRHSDIRF